MSRRSDANHATLRMLCGLLAIASLGSGSATTASAATITFTGTEDLSNTPAAVPNTARCGIGPPNLLVSLSSPGTGTSNLGSFTQSSSHCVNVTTGELFNGIFTDSFGAGNSISGTYVGTISLPPTAGISLTVLNSTITGGTGLYAGATGSLIISGPVTFNPDGTSSSHTDIAGTINTVPEPTAMSLLGLGGLAVAIAVRKLRKSHRDEAVKVVFNNT